MKIHSLALLILLILANGCASYPYVIPEEGTGAQPSGRDLPGLFLLPQKDRNYEVKSIQKNSEVFSWREENHQTEFLARHGIIEFRLELKNHNKSPARFDPAKMIKTKLGTQQIVFFANGQIYRYLNSLYKPTGELREFLSLLLSGFSPMDKIASRVASFATIRELKPLDISPGNSTTGSIFVKLPHAVVPLLEKKIELIIALNGDEHHFRYCVTGKALLC